MLPAEWKNQFGIPFSEHKKALQVNMFDGYTVFSVKEEKPKQETPPEEGAEKKPDNPPEPQGGGSEGE